MPWSSFFECWVLRQLFHSPLSPSSRSSLDWVAIFLLPCMHACMLSHFSHAWLYATLWTAAHQAPLSMGFSRIALPSPSPSGPPDAKIWLIWKDPDAGKDWRQEEKGTTEDEMVGWCHQLSGLESPWVDDGQGFLVCCSPWGHKESDMTEQLNLTELGRADWFKRPNAGKNWGQEDEVVGWHHWLGGHEFGQTSEDSEGQGCLAYCSSWSHKESYMTYKLNKKNNLICESVRTEVPLSLCTTGWFYHPVFPSLESKLFKNDHLGASKKMRTVTSKVCILIVKFNSVQSLSHVPLFATPRSAACQASIRLVPPLDCCI